jgi:hypothetical protein
VTLVDLLRQHWPEYVARVGGASQIPAPHWRAVEAVLSCRTPRLGGHVHRCTDCGSEHYAYHSCNHRACPRCGGAEQQEWSARQQARLLPVPYFMLTFTVPEPMRGLFLRYDRILYKALFAATSGAVKDLFADPKHFGGQPGFIAVLHTWTRQMSYHPHIHLIVPALALGPQGCEVIHARYPEFLLPHVPLAERYRDRFLAYLQDKHPGIASDLDPALHESKWNINVRAVGRGKSALRYLSAYVAKSAFAESRLDGYDRQGRIRLWWTDSADGRPKRMTLEPVEFIRRWLLHVLPRGFTRVRHYGFLSGAARAAYRRLRFLLGCPSVKVILPEQAPLCCPCCDGPMQRMHKIPPARGPPLSSALIPEE